MERIDLAKLEELKKYITKFDKVGIKYFDEIVDLNCKDLINNLGIGFIEALNILNTIEDFKRNIKYYNKKSDCKEEKVNISNKIESNLSENNNTNFNNSSYDPLIIDLGLSVRSRNALLNSGYSTIKDIINLNWYQINNILNIGRKSATEILDVINKYRNNELIVNSNKNISSHDIGSISVDLLPRIKVSSEQFDTRTYNLLINNNINYIDELLKIDLDEFRNKYGVGNKVIKTLLFCINKYQNTYFYKFSLEENMFVTSVFNFDKTESIMDNLNLSSVAKDFLYSLGYSTIEDLLKINCDDELIIVDTKLNFEITKFIQKLKEINKTNYTPNLDDLEKNINSFKFKDLQISKFDFLSTYFNKLLRINKIEKYTLLELFNYIRESNNIDLIYEFYAIFKKYIETYPFDIDIDITEEKLDMCILREYSTLEEIGTKYNKTRERIRQIVVKEHNRIKEYAKDKYIHTLFLRDVCKKNENNTLLSDDSYNKWFDLLYLFNNFEKITYKNDVFYTRKSYIEKNLSILTKLENDIITNGYLLLDEVGYIPDNVVFNYLFDQTNIKKNSYTYYIEDSTNKKVLSYIRRNGTIDLSDGNLDNISKVLEQLLDIYDFDKHNIATRILDYDCCPKGDGSYTLLEYVPHLADSVYELIKENIIDNEIVYCKSLFYKFIDKFPKEYNPYILYYKLKSVFKNQFYYSKGSLAISTLKNPSKANLIYIRLKTSSDPVECSTLYSDFEIDSTALNIIFSQNNDILKFDKTSYWCLSKVKIDVCKEKIINYINRKKSFLINDLYYCISYDFNDVLKDNKITNLEIFTNVISKMFKEELKQYCYDIKSKKFIYKKIDIEKNVQYDDFNF